MILADKIINERKRNGWSQEEFADMLGVSRQAVSKWEGAQSTPDLQRIIQMAELFGVSTDYLLKEEMEVSEITESNGRELDPNASLRLVTLEEANAFISEKEKAAPVIAKGVVLCILSPALLIALAGLTEREGSLLSEGIAVGIGIVVLLFMVAIAVYLFIVSGSSLEEFEYLEKEAFETAYGVSGMVKERKKEAAPYITSRRALGVILCILSSVPLLIAAIAGLPDYVVCMMVVVLLAFVAAGVYIIIRFCSIGSAYDMLLQEKGYSRREKEISKKISPVSGIYWSITTAIYLAWSFLTGRWDFTWIIWPVAGVLFGAVSAIVGIIAKENR